MEMSHRVTVPAMIAFMVSIVKHYVEVWEIAHKMELVTVEPQDLKDLCVMCLAALEKTMKTALVMAHVFSYLEIELEHACVMKDGKEKGVPYLSVHRTAMREDFVTQW